MFTSRAVAAIINFLTPVLTPLGLKGHMDYVPELDFRRAALDNQQIYSQVADITITPILKQIEGAGHENERQRPAWAVGCWSRQSLVNTSSVVYKNWECKLTVDEEHGEAYVVHLKMVDLQLDFAIFCNSPTLAENFEEFLHLYLHNQKELTFNLPITEEAFPLYLNRTDDIRFEKLPSTDVGAVSMVGFSTTITYPIFNDIGEFPVIMQIVQKNFIGSGDDPDAAFLYSTYTFGQLPGD